MSVYAGSLPESQRDAANSERSGNSSHPPAVVNFPTYAMRAIRRAPFKSCGIDLPNLAGSQMLASPPSEFSWSNSLEGRAAHRSNSEAVAVAATSRNMFRSLPPLAVWLSGEYRAAGGNLPPAIPPDPYVDNENFPLLILPPTVPFSDTRTAPAQLRMPPGSSSDWRRHHGIASAADDAAGGEHSHRWHTGGAI